MQSISQKVLSTIEIQKSKFVCILIPLNKLEDVKIELENIKKEYKCATHYCYGYIFDQMKRFSDDGEPGGTAGMPILKVLENHSFNHVLAVVVRYFGGIKLGAGGLVRAYTNSVVDAIEKCDWSSDVCSSDLSKYSFSLSYFRKRLSGRDFLYFISTTKLSRKS